MLILDNARIVVLEMPKTATQALRHALKPYVRELVDKRRHGGYRAFKRHVYPNIAQEWDGCVECCCVVREPLDWARSWYRYRRRSAIDGTDKSTKSVSFDEYIEALLSTTPPPYVQKGRQSRFVGWDGTKTMVDHVFDYSQLHLFLEFLGQRVGEELALPRRNQSVAPVPAPLPADLQSRFRAIFSDDYALYDAVQRSGGHLRKTLPRNLR